MPHVLELSDDELIALRGMYCAGLFTSTPAVRSKLWDRIDEMYTAMNHGKAPKLNGKDTGSAPSGGADESPVPADQRRAS